VKTLARILVVEDEGVVAKDLQSRLRKLGYDVPVTIQTGELALEVARDIRPDLVLMDIRLRGEMDGVEAAGEIMSQFRTPVIFLTAYADDQTVNRAKLTEPYGFVLKPFNERELHTVIQVALHKHAMEAALRKSQRWLSATLRSIDDAIVAVDVDLKILFMNSLAQSLTGWAESEAINRPLCEVVCLADEATGAALEPAVLQSLRNELTEGGPCGLRIKTLPRSRRC
jgi:CheY-like chemotaxis protein